MKPSKWAMGWTEKMLRNTNFANLKVDIAKLVDKAYKVGIKRGRLQEFVELNEQGLLKGKESNE